MYKLIVCYYKLRTKDLYPVITLQTSTMKFLVYKLSKRFLLLLIVEQLIIKNNVLKRCIIYIWIINLPKCTFTDVKNNNKPKDIFNSIKI